MVALYSICGGASKNTPIILNKTFTYLYFMSTGCCVNIPVALYVPQGSRPNKEISIMFYNLLVKAFPKKTVTLALAVHDTDSAYYYGIL